MREKPAGMRKEEMDKTTSSEISQSCGGLPTADKRDRGVCLLRVLTLCGGP